MNLDSLVEEQELVDPLEVAREAWLAKRRGKFTCSRFGDLVSEGRSKGEIFSQTGLSYIRRVVAETLGSYYEVSAKSMEWGTEHEPAAIVEYSKRTRSVVESAPFQFYEYSEKIGGTPDGLVGTDGCIEVKCPWDPGVHINTLITKTVPKDYQWQVVGHLLVTNRQWCDFISFDPRIEGPQRLCVVRVNRDEELIGFLLARLTAACEEMQKMLKLICE